MKFDTKSIKNVVTKGVRASSKAILKTKEKMNISAVKAKKIGVNAMSNLDFDEIKTRFSFLRKVHFNLHHFVSVCVVSLLAFFITLYATGSNTTTLEAFDATETHVKSFNETAIDVSYGDHASLARIAKDILGTTVSDVSSPKLLAAEAQSWDYQIGDYVADITLLEKKKLGATKAEIKIETLATYADATMARVEVKSTDKMSGIENGMVCTYTVDLNVADVQAPTIQLSSAEVTLSEDDTFTAAEYVQSIDDNFDGTLSAYAVEGSVETDGDTLKPGVYTIVYRAVDTSNNEAAASLQVTVEENEEEEVEATPATKEKASFAQHADSPYAGSIVSEARRLIGSAYVWGASGPNAFDCSGFVQYVYGRSGMSIPRTSSAQSTIGNAIDPNDMSQWRAGDIVTFGPGGSSHVAIYSGSGSYIHALNPIQGVLETSIASSVCGTVFAVRRP